jgi:hypothetical protein
MVDLQAAAWAECTKFRLGCTCLLGSIASGGRARALQGRPGIAGTPFFMKLVNPDSREFEGA